jgi:cell division control protein 6
MVFPPYNAEQLRDILNQRSKMAFEDGVLEPSVIPLCSALAAQEHGDARRALDMLRVAAEIAERNHLSIVTDSDVAKAKNKIELDCVNEAIRTLPVQSKLVLMGVVLNEAQESSKLTTGDLYETYKELCQCTSMAILTQRRITDLVSELDMLGLIHARVKSFGRGGRTKEIQLSVPLSEGRRILEEDEILNQLKNYKLRYQTTLM